MDVNQRALYNSLRMNWILNPTLEVEPWQVQEYRSMPLDEIFERLEDRNVNLTKSTFSAFAEMVDTPEELVELLTVDLFTDNNLKNEIEDQVYLLLFELWRRFLPEKNSLSIFCDELDHQIHLYDQGDRSHPEAIQDAIANLEMVLNENVDQGADPRTAFECINFACAHNLETFLHDFISEQIDNENYSYAKDLLEGFKAYIGQNDRFDFQQARILATEDLEASNAMILRLIKHSTLPPNLDFNLELLSFLVGVGENALFQDLVKKTIPLLENEDDFQNLISICAEFYHRLDQDEKEIPLQDLLNSREHLEPSLSFDPQGALAQQFLKLINS